MGTWVNVGVQESLTGPDLRVTFNGLKRCRLSSLVFRGLLGRENVDGVRFKSLQKAKG